MNAAARPLVGFEDMARLLPEQISLERRTVEGVEGGALVEMLGFYAENAIEWIAAGEMTPRDAIVSACAACFDLGMATQREYLS